MKRIKIGYYCADVNPRNTKSLGIYKVTQELLHILVNSSKFEVYLILTEENKEFFKESTCKKIIKRKNKVPYILNKLFFYPSFANKVAKEHNLDILFFPKGHIPFIKNRYTKYVSIINDLIPLHYLRRGRLSMLFSSFLLLWSAKFSDCIITISEYSKSALAKITNNPIDIIPLGCKTVVPLRTQKKNPYFFIIGNKNPHKNLDRSIQLVGEYNVLRGTNYEAIHSLGGLSEEELAGYYQNAEMSLFLSEIEGFGLPLIESYSYYTPVVFNNKTSLAEIGNGLPGACDIDDKKSVFRAIDRVLELNNYQINKERKKLLEIYNWGKCREKIINILQRV